MDELEVVRFLVAERGRALLDAARASRGQDALTRPRALAKGYAAEEVRAALAQDDLRVRAARKTPLAERLLFVRAALEQATPAAVAAERAGRFAAFGRVADLCAGIGLDTIALAAAGPRVVAVERDPVRAMLLRHNVAAAGFAERVDVVEGDAVVSPPEADAAFLDPDRRPGGRRERDPARFEPPADAWDALAARYGHLMVKLPPATRPSDRPGAGLAPRPASFAAGLDAVPGRQPSPEAFGAWDGRQAPARNFRDAGIEWVSLDGEMREARWGTGRLALAMPRRALLLPSGVALEGRGVAWPAPRAPRPGDVLLDPDPAVVVADLVGEAARQVGAAPVHPRIAYLLADTPVPWARCVRLEAVVPARIAEIQAALDARDVGTLDVRTRGVADPPERWRSRLRLRGGARATLVVSRGPDDRYFAGVGCVVGSGATGGGAECIP